MADSPRDAPRGQLPLPQISALSPAGRGKADRRPRAPGATHDSRPSPPSPISLRGSFPSFLNILGSTNTSTREAAVVLRIHYKPFSKPPAPLHPSSSRAAGEVKSPEPSAPADLSRSAAASGRGPSNSDPLSRVATSRARSGFPQLSRPSPQHTRPGPSQRKRKSRLGPAQIGHPPRKRPAPAPRPQAKPLRPLQPSRWGVLAARGLPVSG